MKRTKRFAVLGIVLLFTVPTIVSAVPMTGTGTDALPSDTMFKHRWDGLDDTINSCAPSTAHCTSGCTGC